MGRNRERDLLAQEKALAKDSRSEKAKDKRRST
jgi:hypothetical protein